MFYSNYQEPLRYAARAAREAMETAGPIPVKFRIFNVENRISVEFIWDNKPPVLFVDRYTYASSVRQMIKQGIKHLKENHNIIVHVEDTVGFYNQKSHYF